jgi:hypothetical protein
VKTKQQKKKQKPFLFFVVLIKTSSMELFLFDVIFAKTPHNNTKESKNNRKEENRKTLGQTSKLKSDREVEVCI